MLLEPPDKIKYEGAEIIGRVGAEIILAADVLYETSRMMERFMAANEGKQIPTEMLDQGRIILVKKNLERLIETKLLFAEAVQNIHRTPCRRLKSNSTISSTSRIPGQDHGERRGLARGPISRPSSADKAPP